MVLPAVRRVAGSNGMQICKFVVAGFVVGLLVGMNFLQSSGCSEDSQTALESSLKLSVKPSSSSDTDTGTTPSSLEESSEATYPVLSCSDLRRRVEEGTVRDPNNGIQHVKNTTTTPSFAISLHNEKTDKVRWAIMKYGFYYEAVVTEDWKLVLQDYPPNSIVLYVGMNIGWFSLWTRALGHQTFSFEPNPINQLRLCESLALNNWTSAESTVNVFDMGVGERDEELPFVLNRGDNPGAAGFVRDNKEVGQAKKLRVVTLDGFAKQKGWLDQSDDTVIPLLKVDVEGLDPQVFKGASKLVASGRIKNVFMEYSCHWGDQADMDGVVVQLHSSNYELKKVGGWNGAAIEGALEEIQGDDLAAQLFQYCQKRGKNGSNYQLNLWWILDSQTKIA